ncbi:MAG: histidine kinase, partial [Gammaproteobacteria bacterium]
AARYGKSQAVAATVALVAIVGMIPYIALQLKAVSTSVSTILAAASPGSAAPPLFGDVALFVALAMAAFAVLFGTRHTDATEHQDGLMLAIAAESIVKLMAFIAVGVFVTFVMFHGPFALFARALATPTAAAALTRLPQLAPFGAMTLLSLFAIMLLPRQFHVMVVENHSEAEVRRAAWLFPIYLVLINLFVLPIAIAGRLVLPGGADPDSFVLTLPLAAGQNWLALAAFIGGFSASAGMIIVSAAALSTMVCNDLVMPILFKLRPRALARRGDMIPLLLSIRRAAMAMVMVFGYLYMRNAGEEYSLVSIGLMSFAGVAQFFPAIVLGLFWRRATRAGAIAGIAAGFAVWVYTLALPSFAHAGALPKSFIDSGPFGIGLLNPYALFGLDGLSPVAHSAFWSLIVNVALLVGFSLIGRQSAVERAQAALFVDAFESAKAAQLWRRTAQLPDLMSMVGRFLGQQRAKEMFAAWARRRGRDAAAFEADAELVLYGERLLAGAIGTASARVLVSSVVEEEPLGIDEVM